MHRRRRVQVPPSMLVPAFFFLFGFLGRLACTFNIKEVPNDLSPELQRMVNATGGKIRFNEEMEKMLQQASSLHDGRMVELTEYITNGGSGLIAHLFFDDDVNWAAKIVENVWVAAESVRMGMRAIQAIETYCPRLRTIKIYGHSGLDSKNVTLCYYFMDWVESGFIHDNTTYKMEEFLEDGEQSGRFVETFEFPETFAIQLASFFYNLPACPIPKDKS